MTHSVDWSSSADESDRPAVFLTQLLGVIASHFGHIEISNAFEPSVFEMDISAVEERIGIIHFTAIWMASVLLARHEPLSRRNRLGF
jgi:hypothetical protein